MVEEDGGDIRDSLLVAHTGSIYRRFEKRLREAATAGKGAAGAGINIPERVWPVAAPPLPDV